MYNALSESWCTNVLDKCQYVILSKALLCHLIMFNTCYTEETCLWLASFASLLLISIFPHRRLFSFLKNQLFCQYFLDKIKKKKIQFHLSKNWKKKKLILFLKKVYHRVESCKCNYKNCYCMSKLGTATREGTLFNYVGVNDQNLPLCLSHFSF